MVKPHLWKVIVAVVLAATLVAPGVSATSMVFDSPIPHPSTNDSFSAALPVTSLPYSDAVEMAGAGTEPGEPDPCGWPQQTVWYSYTSATDQPVRVTLSGLADAYLAIFQASGPDISNLFYLSCATWGSPSLAFTASAGTTYYFQVGSIYGYGQTAFLNVEAVLPPANDNFSDAIVISGTSYSESVDVTTATIEAGEPLNNCFYSVQDTVWYKFTAPENGSVYASLGGTWWGETPLSVYRADGEGFGGLSTSLGCSVQAGFSVGVEAGKTYYFQAGTFGWVTGSLYFNMSFTPAPANDSFTDATAITGTSWNESPDVTGATTESGEPQGACWDPPQHTVWYKFTAPSNGAVYTSLWGSYSSDAILNAYRADGEGFGGLSASLGCASWGGSFWFNVQAGKTYYFQAGTIWSSNNVLNFYMSFTPAPANDDFASAKVIPALPYDDSTDMTAASNEAGEPPSCWHGVPSRTVWYAYTPADSGSLSQQTYTWSSTVVAVYTGDSLGTLERVDCRYRYDDGRDMTFHVDAGTTYYFQVGTYENAWVPFHLQVAEPPVANFAFYPPDPNVFDTVFFDNQSWDPADTNLDLMSRIWDFGDGTTLTVIPPTNEPWGPSHRYTKDGDYTVKLTVTTTDGRTASTTKTVPVRTHDVAITKFTAPQSASAGQTRQIVVGVNSKRYVDDVEVQLYKGQVGGGWQWIGTLRQTVPVRPSNRTTDFQFSYTFTKADAAIGKVTFRAVATMTSARDALPADNEAISLPTKVSR